MDSKKKGAPPALLVLMALWALFAGHCSARSMTDFTSSLARGGLLATGGALMSSSNACDGCEPCICVPQTHSCICTDDTGIYPMAHGNEPGPAPPIPQADGVLEMPTSDDGHY
ncbi:hypothetical protein PAHAL_3G253800 [Panicum hallii]|uniref:Bowman-Birk serine protease inhibitors family domain-containing protein n=1 Tax=Panicum hallii TaxID=206008 RepID=A0A2S3HBF2_9POAL|nr:uncharacterized protein LOC112887305 [Panicum hallii]PAN19165.1 hypothetical protein PAHAL_3G253800 [Panicum hallii]